jgi:hypothetical protein
MQQQPEQPMPPPPAVQTQPSTAPATYTGETNTLAVVSLISGIVSWFAVPLIGGVVAVVTGHMAKREIRRTGEKGETFATVGLVLGYLHLAVVLLIAALVVLVLVGTFAAIRTTTSG